MSRPFEHHHQGKKIVSTAETVPEACKKAGCVVICYQNCYLDCICECQIHSRELIDVGALRQFTGGDNISVRDLFNKPTPSLEPATPDCRQVIVCEDNVVFDD